MTKLTVKQVIASTLLRICREATNKVRPKEDAKPRKYSQEQVDNIHELFKQIGWSTDKATVQMKIYAALCDAPELATPTMIPLELWCVVVFGNSEGNGYQVGDPWIVSSAKSQWCLAEDGCVNNWAFHATHKPRLATDEEIQLCIESLTDKQWTTIHTHEIFRPIMEAAMAQAVSVDMEPVTGNGSMDSEEHILPDGRKITVDTE